MLYAIMVILSLTAWPNMEWLNNNSKFQHY